MIDVQGQRDADMPGPCRLGRRYIRRKTALLCILLVVICLLLIQVVVIGNYMFDFDDGIVKTIRGVTHSTVSQINTEKSEGVSLLSKEELLRRYSCENLHSEANSAIDRAKSEKCKSEITNLACLNGQNKLFKSSLPYLCPRKAEYSFGTFIGCYKQDSVSKANLFLAPVNSRQYKASKAASGECIQLCLQGGYNFSAFTQRDCLCGNKLPNLTFLQSNSPACNNSISCTVASKNCTSAAIYSTGIFSRNKGKDLFLPDLKAVNSTSKVRIVFLLTLNGRAIRHVKRLLKLIYRPHHFYYIHVDKRQTYLPRTLQWLERNYTNIRMAKTRLPTMWGGATLLTMLLQCIKDLLHIKAWKWDFVTNMSESDFPIKPIEDLERYLQMNMNKNFLKSHGYNTFNFIRKQGLDKLFHQCDDHMWKLGDRKLPTGIVYDGGSDWIALNRKFSQYVTFESNRLINGLKQLFSYSLLPAEAFFHTLLINSRMCDTVMDNNLRTVNWQRSRGCKCQYKHIVDWCGCSPNDFTPNDWARIKKLDKKANFFARKFEAIVFNEIINKVEEHVNNNSHNKITSSLSYNSYWQSEYHHLDTYPSRDEAKLSVFSSLANISLKYMKYSTKNGDYDNECSIKIDRINEVFTYKRYDSYEGSIIQFQSSISDANGKVQMVTMETHAIPRQEPLYYDLGGTKDRLKSVKVNTDYDAKENIFRNFLQAIGPHSDLVVETEWHDGNAVFTVSMVWIDPSGVVAISYDSQITSTTKILQHKPKLKKPLRPGKWNFKLLVDLKTQAEVSFMVFPFTQVNNQFISSQSQALEMHSGPGNYSQHDFKYLDDLLAVPNAKILKLRAEENAKKHSQDLQQWMDSLIMKQYTIKDICYFTSSNHPFQCPNIRIEPCHIVKWSSFYPDPKSYIHGFDEQTGKMF